MLLPFFRPLRAAHALLQPEGRLVFDVFAPSREDVEETHGRWIEREPERVAEQSKLEQKRRALQGKQAEEVKL